MAGYDIKSSRGQTKMPYSSAIALGLVNNVSQRRVSGHGTVGTSFTMISTGNLLWLPTVASTLRIKAGGDATDTAAGTGAQSVLIQGLDANGLEIQEVVATNGILASAVTTLSFLRVSTVTVYAAGSGETNAAAITIEVGAGGTDVAQISAGEGRFETSHLPVPSNKTVLFQALTILADVAKQITTRVVWRTPDGVRITLQNIPAIASPVTVPLLAQLAFNTGVSDIWLEGLVSSGTGDIMTSADAHLYVNAE
jgi:hypothetical protein